MTCYRLSQLRAASSIAARSARAAARRPASGSRGSPPRSWHVYLGAVLTAGCFVLWYTGVRLLGVERAGLLTGVMPAGAPLIGAVLGLSALTPERVAAGIAVGMRAARVAAPPAASDSAP
jgi:drug/metabolite transporter (DMT)-like permease